MTARTIRALDQTMLVSKERTKVTTGICRRALQHSREQNDKPVSQHASIKDLLE
jgi:hypothetical protein